MVNEEGLRRLMKSIASEMPAPDGTPRRVLSRARRRAVTLLAVTLTVVAAVAAGAVVGVEALTGHHGGLPGAPGPATFQEPSPAADQIRFVSTALAKSLNRTAGIRG